MITHFNIIQIAAVPWNILYFGRRHHRHWNWRNGICHSAACCFLFLFSSVSVNFLQTHFVEFAKHLQYPTYSIENRIWAQIKLSIVGLKLLVFSILNFVCIERKKTQWIMGSHWTGWNVSTGCFEVNVWLFLRKRQQKFKKKSKKKSNSLIVRQFESLTQFLSFAFAIYKKKPETFLR